MKGRLWIFLALSIWSLSLYAEDKIKIEIVEMTSIIQRVESGGVIFTFHAKAIMPDGSHASLVCVPGGSSNCAAIEPFAPEKMSPDSSSCVTDEGKTTCTTKNLGSYWAKRNANELLIIGPKHKLKYHIVGSWLSRKYPNGQQNRSAISFFGEGKRDEFQN